MKTSRVGVWLTAMVAATLAYQSPANAAEQEAAPTSAPVAATPVAALPVQLSNGVEEVLKLARAKVGDDVIVAFIKNSGRRYSLTADEIVYLRGQGVPDRAVTAMLNQQQSVAPAAPQDERPTAVGPTPATSDAAMAYSSPVTTVVQPASTVYVVPDSTTYYYSYPYYPYYPYSWAWYTYPAFSFGFYYGWGYDDDNDCWKGYKRNYCDNGNSGGNNHWQNNDGNGNRRGGGNNDWNQRSGSQNSNYRRGGEQNSAYSPAQLSNERLSRTTGPTRTWSNENPQSASQRNNAERSTDVVARTPQNGGSQTRANTTSTWTRNDRQTASLASGNQGRYSNARDVRPSASQGVSSAANVWNRGSSSDQNANVRARATQAPTYRSATPQRPNYRSTAPQTPSYPSSAAPTTSYRSSAPSSSGSSISKSSGGSFRSGSGSSGMGRSERASGGGMRSGGSSRR